MRAFPKKCRHLNIVLPYTAVAILKNSKLEDRSSKILENSKSNLPNFGIFEKLEENK